MKSEHDMARPIFIVGAPRSGTTLMRDIIDAHPRIVAPTWETGLFVYLDSIVQGDFQIVTASDDTFPVDEEDLIEWVGRTACDLMKLLVSSVDKPRWAEKTPAHVYHLSLIDRVFPNAQFIHMIRDGKDVVRSLRSMNWAVGDIRWSVARWVGSVRAGRAFGQTVGVGKYHEVRYEKLLESPTDTLMDVCDFLGEEFTPTLLDFHKPENNSWGRSQAPLSLSPVNTHQGLSVLERCVFWLRARALYRELNYGQ